MAQIVRTQNQDYHFNEYNKIEEIDILYPSIIMYLNKEINKPDIHLAIEYVEIPKAHFQNFNPSFLDEITDIWISQLFSINDYTIKEDKRQLRLGIENIKRTFPFKYGL